MYDGIIFTGSDSSQLVTRTIGAYRIRSVCAKFGYKIKVIDFSDSLFWDHARKNNYIARLLDRYVTENTLFYGISSTFLPDKTISYLLHEKIISFIKKKNPKIQVMLGGARVNPSTRQQHVDWAISGYADTSIIHFLDFLTGKTNTLAFTENNGLKYIDSNKNYEFKDTSDLTNIWLKEDFIQPHESLPIEISRGCIFKCSFCAYPLNGKKKFDYIRDADNFGQEIARNYSEFGVKHYMFMDDTFNDSDFKLQLISKAIKDSGINIKFCSYIKPELLVAWPEHVGMLVDMGIEGASLGIESFYPKTRIAIGKGMKIEKIMDALAEMRRLSNYSVGTQANMIVGAPWEPRSSIEQSRDWFKSNTDIINTVQWTAMAIYKVSDAVYSSAIDLNPEQFGYRVDEVKNSNMLSWTNEYFTSAEAKKFKNEIVAEMRTWDKLGGWQPGMKRLHNAFDVTKALQENKLRAELNREYDQRGATTQFIYNYFNYQLNQ